MPLIAIRIGNPDKGHSFSILIEITPGVDYSKLGMIVSALTLDPSSQTKTTLKKLIVKMLLGMAQLDRECMCLRYSICKSSGMTPTAARRKYGFTNTVNHAHEVEDALVNAQKIREAILELAAIEDRAFIQSLGIDAEDDSEEEDIAGDSAVELSSAHEIGITDEHLKMLRSCDFNWFQFMENQPDQKECFLSLPSQSMLESFDKCSVDEHSRCLLKQSYLAFCAAEGDMYDQDRTARIVNGEVVSESESDNPEEYSAIKDPLSIMGKEMITKKRAQIRRRARRKQEKAVADQHFLQRTVSKRVSSIVQKYPDIGETIEMFVQDHQVGADAWRRTGVLTFDGNSKVKKKVTYERI